MPLQPQEQTPEAANRGVQQGTQTVLIPISQDELRRLLLRQTRAFLKFRSSRKQPDHSYVRNTICLI